MSTRGFVGYKHKGKIRGWYNHSDSYPSGLGVGILERVYNLYTWQVIRDFFLKKLVLIDEDENQEAYFNHRSILEHDWASKKKITLADGGEFYKDGLFCEYAYIFDLDSDEKTLMLFAGFGKKASRGYKDWFYTNHDKTKYYVNLKGCITGVYDLEILVLMLYAAHYDPKIYKILGAKKEELPTWIGYQCIEEDYHREEVSDCVAHFIEKRLKGEQDASILLPKPATSCTA